MGVTIPEAVVGAGQDGGGVAPQAVPREHASPSSAPSSSGLSSAFVALGRLPLLPRPELSRPHRRRQLPAGRGGGGDARSSAGSIPCSATALAVLAGALGRARHRLPQRALQDPAPARLILTMIALFSINLRIMGRPNVALLSETTVLTPFEGLGLPLPTGCGRCSCSLVVAVVRRACWSRFLPRELGLAMRATGANPRMARGAGHLDRPRMTCLGMALSNALVALAGALFAQTNGFADVTIGIGTIVVGLAAVIVGETLLPRAEHRRGDARPASLGSIALPARRRARARCRFPGPAGLRPQPGHGRARGRGADPAGRARAAAARRGGRRRDDRASRARASSSAAARRWRRRALRGHRPRHPGKASSSP